ncbi:MAG: hypothetical protein GXO90_01335 [FCB group bacterium]|nr:hypothetical protein [FCB group bacterium]
MFKKFAYIFWGLIIIISCDTGQNPVTDTSNPQISLSRVLITSTSIPPDVDEIIGILSNTDGDSFSNTFTIENDSAYCVFEDVPVGTWNIDVSAYFEGQLTYHGTASVEVLENMITSINIFMERINGVGSIHIGLTWDTDGYETYNYSFNDNSLAGWYGPADLAVINQKLHVSSVSGYENYCFTYHTIQADGDQHFVDGEIEIDIYPEDGTYHFGTKGATNSFIGELVYAIQVVFRSDTVYVVQNANTSNWPENTDYSFSPYQWYRLRFRFDNNAGEKGKFDFWITDLSDTNTVYLGQYNYKAPYGSLIGVNQFVLAVGDPAGTNIKEGIFDNIEFWVR